MKIFIKNNHSVVYFTNFFVSRQKDSYFSSSKYQTLALLIVFCQNRMTDRQTDRPIYLRGLWKQKRKKKHS